MYSRLFVVHYTRTCFSSDTIVNAYHAFCKVKIHLIAFSNCLQHISHIVRTENVLMILFIIFFLNISNIVGRIYFR